jgi:hypothetical protein
MPSINTGAISFTTKFVGNLLLNPSVVRRPLSAAKHLRTVSDGAGGHSRCQRINRIKRMENELGTRPQQAVGHQSRGKRHWELANPPKSPFNKGGLNICTP